MAVGGKYGRIKDLRVDFDLGQKELADYLNISRSAYSNYENNLRSIPVEVLVDLANFYHTSVDYLLGRAEEPKPTLSTEMQNK